MSGFADEIRQEGREEAQEEKAIKLLEDGKMTQEEIVYYTGLSLDDIKELVDELNLMSV